MKRVLATACMLGLAAAPLLAGELVILETNVPGLAPGDVIDGDGELVLDQGHKLTLIAESGEVMEISGPYAGAVPSEGGGGDDSLVSEVASLITSAGTDVSSLGAVRAGEGGTAPGDPWYIDIAEPGTHCAPADGSVNIWRRSAESFSVLAMRPAGAERGGRLQWPEGSALQDWPPFMEIEDGAVFDIVLDDGAPYQIRFRVVPESLPSDAHRAAWMARHGCKQQAIAILRMVVR